MTTNRREAIVEATVELFRAKGYAGTSMQDIADAVGLLKSSLYHYFPSKEDLLYEIHERFMAFLLHKADARLQSTDLSARQRFEAVVNDLLALIRDYRAYVEVFFRERYLVQGARWEKIHATREAYEAMVRDIVADGQRDGSFRKDLDAKMVTFGLFGMCNWTYQWMQPEGRYSPDMIATLFAGLLLDGLVARP